MQVGDRVRWVPTGQEGRVMELRDGGIISVFGEDGLGNWAIYDYADRFELVNECRRGETCYESTGNGAEG